MSENNVERIVITRGHFLFRRIASFEMEIRDGAPYVLSSAFRRAKEESGVSVYVEGIETAEEAWSHGSAHHGIAMFSAAVPLENDMPVVHMPVSDAPGHAEIMQVSGDSKKRKLARACSVVIMPTEFPEDRLRSSISLDD